MSIGSMQHDSQVITPPFHAPGTGEIEGTPSSLARLTGSAGFATVAPRLQAALELMTLSGNVVETLMDNIAALQEGFVDTLYASLLRSNVDISRKVTLRLDESALLKAAADHPDTDSINAMLGAAPELSAAFSEIAAQSAALRDIHNLHTAVMHTAGRGASRPETRYQVSIKGDMNHFYFSR